FPGPIAGGIEQDGHEPGPCIGTMLELMPRPKGFETRLLHQIFSLVRGPYQAAGTTPQQGQVRFGYALKGLWLVIQLGHARPQNRCKGSAGRKHDIRIPCPSGSWPRPVWLDRDSTRAGGYLTAYFVSIGNCARCHSCQPPFSA